MSVPERAVFAAMKAAIVADTGSGGLNESGSILAPVARNFVWADDRDGNRAPHRIEFSGSSIRFPVWDSTGAENSSRYRVAVRLVVICPRDQAFGTGDTPEAAGHLDNLVQGVEALFNGNTTLALTDWDFSSMWGGNWSSVGGGKDNVVRQLPLAVFAEKTS